MNIKRLWAVAAIVTTVGGAAMVSGAWFAFDEQFMNAR